MNLSDVKKLVINLPERTDRLAEFREQEKYIKSNALVVHGIRNPDPKKGVAQAHINAIDYAIRHRLDHVLIMEDDCIFPAKDKTLEHINLCLANLPDEWDILLGGVYDSYHLRPYNNYWNSVGQFCALHFYIVNRSAYSRFLKYDGKHHLDRWLNLNNTDLKCFVSKDFFAIQSNGYSDNVKSKVNYDKFLKRYSILR